MPNSNSCSMPVFNQVSNLPCEFSSWPSGRDIGNIQRWFWMNLDLLCIYIYIYNNYMYIIVEALWVCSTTGSMIYLYCFTGHSNLCTHMFRSHKIPAQKWQMSSAFCKPGALADLNIWLQIPQSSWLLALQIRYLLWFPKQGNYIHIRYIQHMYIYILILHTWNPCVPYLRLEPSKKRSFWSKTRPTYCM